MDTSRLNDYSRTVAEHLLQAMPELNGYSGVDDLPDEEGCLLIQIPSANSAAHGNLYLTTAGGEITIGWDRWHTHCGMGTSEKNEA